jgi:esterase/lipase superfamily enzyme
MKTMTAEDLVRKIANKARISKKAARRLIAELIKTATKELQKGRVFVFPGLGRMMTIVRPARNGRHSYTGASIKIARRTVAKFRFSKKAREVIENERVSKSLRPIVRVFYATDREPNPRSRARFGSRRSSSEELHLGTSDVSIPRDHRMAKIERPSILRFELRENPAKHFVIKEITEKNSTDFYSELSGRVRRSEGKEALVFIHGFRVAFEDAIYRTAQIAYDLAFAGAPILYSWPSNEKLYEYIGDINNNDWTTDHLKVFLQDLASTSGAKTIHLIAHSMGNRALVNALNHMELSSIAPKPRFSQIVLTAPDIDANLFERMANAIRTMAKRITLYASNHDRALTASKKLNGSYPRAGDSSHSVVVVQGVDTIDASAVDTNLIGHFYYAENRSVLSDIFDLLRHGCAPEKRFGIRPVPAVRPYLMGDN